MWYKFLPLTFLQAAEVVNVKMILQKSIVREFNKQKCLEMLLRLERIPYPSDHTGER
jgi:hypothetical protein